MNELNNLKATLIGLLQAFIALVKAEPGQQAELDVLKAKVADLQEQLAGALPLDDELRSVIAEAAEAAATATPAGTPDAKVAPAPVADVQPEVNPADVPPTTPPPAEASAVEAPAPAPAAEATEGGEPAPADKPV